MEDENSKNKILKSEMQSGAPAVINKVIDEVLEGMKST